MNIPTIQKSDCDAGVFSNLFGLQIMETIKVERTQILFAPTKLKVAVGKNLNREIMEQQILERLGYQVTSHISSVEAL